MKKIILIIILTFYCSAILFAQNLPGEPSNPVPVHGAIDVSITTDISWTNGADTDDVEVLFGKQNPPVDTVYDGIAVETLTNAQIGGPLDMGEVYYWQVIAKNVFGNTEGPIWYFSTEYDNCGPFPIVEDLEPGFFVFENALGNDVNWNLNTSIFVSPVNSAHNAYGPDNTNIGIQKCVFDIAGSTYLNFWHIAKTEGDYDHCYVEISFDEGYNWTILPESTYEGLGTYEVPLFHNPEGPCFDEDSYPIWQAGIADDSWWQLEVFNLSGYIGNQALIRFRLVSNSSNELYGWVIDDITITEDSCLPVELTNFTGAVVQGEFVQITWTCESESDMNGYKIYRSETDLNSADFSSALIDAANFSYTHDYLFEDYEVEDEKTYNYWLEGISNDGSTDMWGPLTIYVEFEDDEEYDGDTELFNVYPNPVFIDNDLQINIRFAVKTGENATLSIYNIKGQLLESYKCEQGIHEYHLDTGSYSSGLYLYQLKSEGYFEIKKMMILK